MIALHTGPPTGHAPQRRHDACLMARDVREGYVSRDAAHRDNGVIVTGDGKLSVTARKNCGDT